jgi:hypothetical protein
LKGTMSAFPHRSLPRLSGMKLHAPTTRADAGAGRGARAQTVGPCGVHGVHGVVGCRSRRHRLMRFFQKSGRNFTNPYPLPRVWLRTQDNAARSTPVMFLALIRNIAGCRFVRVRRLRAAAGGSCRRRKARGCLTARTPAEIGEAYGEGKVDS